MTRTILITGSSSGVGRATAILFQEQGWNVVATMRRPEDERELSNLDNVLVTRLDVTDLASIEAAVAAGIERFGSIDVLVNNAGYGAYGPVEAIPHDKIVRQFATNVIGLIDTTRALLPHFRGRSEGTVVNVSSVGGRVTFPLGALYHGTKFAVEGISEAMAYEFDAIGVSMKIVEPGIVDTDFAGRSMDVTFDPSLTEYQPVAEAVIAAANAPDRYSSPPSLIAEVILDAVTDGTDQLRYTAGDDAAQLVAARAASDDATLLATIRDRFGLTRS